MTAKMTIGPAGAAFALALAVAAPAAAHHSGSQYDGSKEVDLKGRIQSFSWVNPHTRFLVTVDPGEPDAGKTWMVETTATGRLERDGWTRHSLNPGDHVLVRVRPDRDGALQGNLFEVSNLDTGVLIGKLDR